MISVVIPVYNGGRTIRRAIESALAQEVPVQIVVTDDRSTDDTREICLEYQEKGLLTYHLQPDNLGAAKNRNTGVAMAKGEYIAFLDADDWWEPGKLKAQLELMERTKAVMCSTARRLHCPGDSRHGQIIHMPAKVTYKELLSHNSIACSSVLIRREVAAEFPMAHSEIHEDYLTWLRILQKYDCCCGLDVPYLNYTLSTTGKSGSKLKSAAMTFGVYRTLGLGPLKSMRCFVKYALHGVWKYYGPDKNRE